VQQLNFKKIIACIICCMFMLSFVGCDDSNDVVVTDGYNGILINDGKPITLIVDLNTLMPTTNSEPTEQNPLVFNSIRGITAEFCSMFPNVTIEWAYSKKSSGDWAQWMTTQIATNPPDIVMMHTKVATIP